MQSLGKSKITSLLVAGAALAALFLSAEGVQSGTPDGDIECSKEVNGLDAAAVVEPGEAVTFDVLCTVSAVPVSGTVPAGDMLVITDTLFANFQIEGASCDSGPSTGFTNTDEAVIEGQDVACIFEPDLVDTEFRLSVLGSFDDGPCGDYTNGAEATYDDDLEQPEVDFVLACENLSVEKTASTTTDTTGATVAPGGAIRYAVEVCNTPVGDALAEDVVLTDTLPAGVTYQSSDSDQVTANADGSVITATVDVLAAGECATLFIDVLIAADAPCGFVLTNSAAVASTTGSTFDLDTSNNDDSVTTTVACVAAADDNAGDGETDDGSGPVVSTGNSGLEGANSAVTPWHVLAMIIAAVPTAIVGAIAYRRLG